MCRRTAGSAARPGSAPKKPKMPHMSGTHVNSDGGSRRLGGMPRGGHRGQGHREPSDVVEVKVVRDRMKKPGHGESAETDLDAVRDVPEFGGAALVSDLL